MKKIFLFLVIATIISCEGIQYDGEKRLVFQTVVLNSSSQPLPNSHVEIAVNSSLISQGKTDQNGRITLIFPAPSSDLSINLKVYSDEASYMQKEILNLRKADFENYKFIYQNNYLLKLEETAPLQLTYNHTSANTRLNKLSINGIYTVTQGFYSYTPPGNFFLPDEILIKKNQSFQLKYVILNTQTNVETEHVIELTIGNDPLSYNINY